MPTTLSNLKLYAAPNTRAFRVVWLLEELDLAYELQKVVFKPTVSDFFVQDTPTGKIPTLEDDGVVISESGAIVEYLLERYGEGALAPAVEDKRRGTYLQWVHFSESTAFPPLGIVVWLTRYRSDAEQHPQLVADAIGRAERTLAHVDEHLQDQSHLLGDEFSAADIMMTFTLMAARQLGITAKFPVLSAYLDNMLGRACAQRALQVLNS